MDISKEIIEKEQDDANIISEGESDDNLRIDFECTGSLTKKRVTSTPAPNHCEQMIIESIEDELEKQLTEKAAKTKLNAIHVKNIIRHVVTNEQVLALIRQAENPEDTEENLTVYEPKLTRSKAKELLKYNPAIPPVPWVATKAKPSETHVLVGEDLQEDSSGDEYVPGEDESEDEKESSIASEVENLSLPSSIPPASVTTEDTSTQTNWTEDGVFKIPPSIPQSEEATIALRTRSKINLSSTPLEVIETSFIPPDVTTDMYDMECDDEDWAEFLKGFMQPIDQLTKGTEDEDHDPEYNIMADEVGKIDKDELKEELRVDKAVKVSKKELNMLWEELFEFAEMYADGQDKIEKSKKQCSESTCPLNETSVTADCSMASNASDSSQVNATWNSHEPQDGKTYMNETFILRSQVSLVEHQMRQHVQILVQNFLLLYEHPEFHHYSLQQKEYLMNLKLLSENKKGSTFSAVNLSSALALIASWESDMIKNSESAQQHKLHVNSVLGEALQKKNSGNFNYVPTFSRLMLDVVSKSDVFLYPSLLPKIPYKSASFFSSTIHTFSESEDRLLAVGLEQFTPIVQENKKNIMSNGEVKLKPVCSFIHDYMMPHASELQILNRISYLKHTRSSNNPIKYFYQNKQAPPVMHYVPMNTPKLPPCQQAPESLPQLWRAFIYPASKLIGTQPTPIKPNTPIILSDVQPLKIQIQTGGEKFLVQFQLEQLARSASLNTTAKRYRRTKGTVKPTFKRRTFLKAKRISQTPLEKFVNCLKQISPIEKLSLLYPTENHIERDSGQESTIMLPSMPSLQTPIKICPKSIPINSSETAIKLEKDVSEYSENNSEKIYKPQHDLHCFEGNKLGDVSLSTTSTETTSGCTPAYEDYQQFAKDDPTAINDLMIASSTVKPISKKEPSGAEKKRAKIRREFVANLAVATPEDETEEQHKSERFALAYYDKLRDTLELEDYHKIMQVLNDCQSGDAVDLYRQMEQILRPKFEELAEELLLFLREREAATVGRLMPWIQMNAKSKFLRKLEIYFKDQPAQLKKIYKCLTELSQTVDVTMEKAKSTLLPMLKGNAILTDLFIQNFANERPPPSLLEGPYETVDFNKEMGRTSEGEMCENISIPDVEDKYGGFSCMCSCHKIEDPEFKSRSRHCIPCGTRFIQGKVYIQTGRGPKPATVSFLTGKHTNHNVRLLGKAAPSTHRKKRSDQSPSKHLTTVSSPSKENPDDDTEEEIYNKKKPKSRSKSPRKRKKQIDTIERSQNSKKDIYNLSISKESLAHNCDTIESDNASKDCKSRKRTHSMRTSKINDLIKVEKVNLEGETEEEFIENFETSYIEQHSYDPGNLECDLNGSGESTEKPCSPGAQTADSESDTGTPTKKKQRHSEVTNFNFRDQGLYCGQKCDLEKIKKTSMMAIVQSLGRQEYEKAMIEAILQTCVEHNDTWAADVRLRWVAVTVNSNESPKKQTLCIPGGPFKEFCEESSQDNCESDSSSCTESSASNTNSQSDTNTEDWKKGEDRIILETFQQENDKEYAFKIISKKLTNRTIREIRNRFSTLMALLLEQIGRN